MKNTSRRGFLGFLTALFAAPAIAKPVASGPSPDEMRRQIMATNLCPEITSPSKPYSLAADFDGDTVPLRFQMPQETMEQLMQQTIARLDAANKRELDDIRRTLAAYNDKGVEIRYDAHRPWTQKILLVDRGL